MSMVKRKMDLLEENEAPSKKLISDADIFIKQLAEKQRITTISLQKQLQEQKEFIKGTELVPLKSNTGTTSLEEFQQMSKSLEEIGILKAAGLTEDDIQLIFDSLKGSDYLLQKHKNWERSSLDKHLCVLHNLINNYKSTHDLRESGITKKQKHDRVECGLSVKPDSNETKLLKFALNTQKQNKLILPHPMNNIKDIEKESFAHLNNVPLPPVSKIRRKARKLLNRINNITNSTISVNKLKNSNRSLTNNSQWDIMDKEEFIVQNCKKKVHTCLPQNYYTIRNGEIVKLNKGEINAKGLEVAPKLNLEEIKLLPKFQNYEPGEPTNKLYLKNLSNNIKEEELKQLFNNFGKESNIIYNIMKGKLRGQAFVTFPDENIAKQALEDINGTFIKNKPVIIQFGHRKNDN